MPFVTSVTISALKNIPDSADEADADPPKAMGGRKQRP